VSHWQLWLPPALTKPRFRLYVAGHAVSVIGSWFQQVALSWLVYRLTGSVFLLGLTGFLLNISYLLLGAVAGAIVDRLPRALFLIAINLVLAGLSACLTVLAGLGASDIRFYLCLATLIGVVNAFEMPVRQTLFKDIIEDKALLSSAIAVSAMVFNVGRIVGPALAGLLLQYVSEAGCFAVNTVSYTGIILALIAMRLPTPPVAGSVQLNRPGFVDGLSAVITLPAVRYLIPTMVATGLFATPYLHLMPSIVVNFFDGKSSTLGLLMAASGIGALSTAAYLSLQIGYSRQLRLVTLAPLAVGIALFGFAWSRTLALSMLTLAVLGGSIMLTSNSTNVLLQQSVTDEWRGRVIGIYTMSFAGTAPLGNLLAGVVADRIGVTATLTCNALLILLAASAARWRLTHDRHAIRDLRRALGH
jgi:MFS family permease